MGNSDLTPAARRRYLRALRLPGGGGAALLALAPGPGLLAAACAADLSLHVFSANGAPLVSAEGTERLAALAASPCGRFLVTGGARGAVTLLWLHSLEARGPHLSGASASTCLARRARPDWPLSAPECAAAGAVH